MTVCLPGIDVLVAVVESTHVQRDAAHAWFGAQARDPVRPCALYASAKVKRLLP